MSSCKTNGIVIKGSNFGEADKILTVFTERFGKVKVIAKGIRRMKSHLAGSLEPFMLTDLMLYEGSTFYTITGASIIQDFPNIHSDLKLTAKAFLFGELIDKFLKEKEGTADIFDLYVSVLSSIENGSQEALVALAFEFKLTNISGFSPQLYECVHCKTKITPCNNYWDQSEGGIICGDCQAKFNHGINISDGLIKLFRFFEKSNFEDINRLRINDLLACEAQNVLTSYTRSILEQELKSQRFIDLIR